MTLVLGYVCNDFVLQVSDRRLSRGSEPLPAEFNKAVVWCGLALVGYTGYAFVDRRQREPVDQVDEWIMQQLYGCESVEQVIRALAERTPDWLDRMPGTWRAQAYNAVGWAPQLDGSMMPFAALISNFHDERGMRLPATLPTFSLVLRIPPPGPWFVADVGEPLLPAEVRILQRTLDRLSQEPPEPGRVADVLVRVARMVSQRAPRRVGQAVMVSCLPKPTPGEPQPFLTERGGKPAMDAPTFFYRGGQADDSEAYGPLWVCGDRGYSDMSLKYLNESGSDASISVRLRGPGN